MEIIHFFLIRALCRRRKPHLRTGGGLRCAFTIDVERE
jgi:hypothetical protein